MASQVSVNRHSIVVLRIMLSGIFLLASISHLINVEQTAARIEAASFKSFAHFFGPPEILVILSGIVMLVAGIAFVAGFRTRLSAIILILVLIPITITIQMGQTNSLGPLFKNIGILGGLLFFVLNDFKNKSQTINTPSKESTKNTQDENTTL